MITDISPTWYGEATEGRLPVTDEIVARAKAFVLSAWRARAVEKGYAEPRTLSGSCKFTSLFAKLVFGGMIVGHEKHQFVVVNGRILDLNEEAGDVLAMKTPHFVDRTFVGNPKHHDSMQSCFPRVNDWVEHFLKSEGVEV